MFKISSLTNTYTQKQNISFSEITNVLFTFSYYPTQRSWMYSIEYDDFKIENQRLHISYNALDKYKNIIPFGLMVTSLDGGEPLYLDDFVIPRINLYILTKEEAENVHDNYFRSWMYD